MAPLMCTVRVAHTRKKIGVGRARDQKGDRLAFNFPRMAHLTKHNYVMSWPIRRQGNKVERQNPAVLVL